MVPVLKQQNVGKLWQIVAWERGNLGGAFIN